MKKIMFNDRYGLTEAVLKGRKTMTRRIIRNLSNFDPRQDWMEWGNDEKGKANIAIFHNETYKYCIYPQYQPGEVVAVAQSYKDAGVDPHFLMFQPIEDSVYRSEMEIEAMYTGGWNNKMFVHPDLMPHQIQITNIKVERLQDISDEDCMCEGIFAGKLKHEQPNSLVSVPLPYGGYVPFTFTNAKSDFLCAKDAFAALIDKISGKGMWDKNPYVFAYTFELVK